MFSDCFTFPSDSDYLLDCVYESTSDDKKKKKCTKRFLFIRVNTFEWLLVHVTSFDIDMSILFFSIAHARFYNPYKRDHNLSLEILARVHNRIVIARPLPCRNHCRIQHA